MSSPLPIDPYEVLGVPRNADLSAIRAAHRKLVLKYHPDRIKDEAQRKKGTEEFQKAQQAYELLADDKRRARYDDQIRLAQLKKETMMERGMPVRSATYSAQPSAPPRTTYESGRVYEERRPSRYSDDDDRYPEPPRSTRKTSGYERRPATAYTDEKKKKHPEKTPSIFSTLAESKLREKAREARERAARAEAAKSRDRERRHDTSDKYSRRTAYVEEESSSDSDTYVPRRPEAVRRKTYYEEPQRRRQDSPPARKQEARRPVSDTSSSDSDDDSDAYNDEWLRRHDDAKHYISERSTNGRPSVLRTDSAKYYAVSNERNTGRKSGSDKDDRRDDRPKTSKASRPEVVEPPRRSPQSRKQAPPMTTAKSSPAGLKGMTRDAHQPQRSATGDYSTDHKRPMPSMPRSNTMPMPTTRKEPVSSRSSKLKQTETHDSGYGSSVPVTPELHGSSPPKNPKTTTSKFFIVEEDPEHSRSGYRTVPAGETYSSRRTQSPPPLTRDREREDRRDRDKKRSERPPMQSNPSYRSAQYTVSPEQLSSRPQAFRTDSSRSTIRDPPPLSRGESGGHRTHGKSSKGEGYSFKPESVKFSPQLSPDNIKQYARRHASELRDRDYFPGSSHHEDIHPKSGRRPSVFT